MKKLFCILAVLVLSLSLISCGGDETPSVDPDMNVGPNGEINFPIVDYTPPSD